jgi:hypothetical protein
VLPTTFCRFPQFSSGGPAAAVDSTRTGEYAVVRKTIPYPVGSAPLDFHLCEKTKTGEEKPEDNVMITVFRFLAICTISIVAVLSALFLVALSGLPAAAQQTPSGPQVLSKASV